MRNREIPAKRIDWFYREVLAVKFSQLELKVKVSDRQDTWLRRY